MRIKPFSRGSCPPVEDVILRPCTNLGTRIADQMYHGVDSSNSTLITGAYDDEDNFDVDPACDMRTDRFDLKEPVLVSPGDSDTPAAQ